MSKSKIKSNSIIVKGSRAYMNGILIGAYTPEEEGLRNPEFHEYYLIYKDEDDRDEIEILMFYSSGGCYERELAEAFAKDGYQSGYKLVSRTQHEFVYANRNF